MTPKIVVWANGDYKVVQDGNTWEYEDGAIFKENIPYLVTIPTIDNLNWLIERCETEGSLDKWQLFYEHGNYSIAVTLDEYFITKPYGTPQEAFEELYLKIKSK